jgi:hypothetical protein
VQSQVPKNGQLMHQQQEKLIMWLSLIIASETMGVAIHLLQFEFRTD